MSLYIGTNYHPHDWPEQRWKTDVELMKGAGFTTVRLGHLCWDSYEPEEGVYTFEWFDKVMDLFHEAGIGVVLDVSMRPAPRWVHKLCPGCDICGPGGIRQSSLHRYMEDVGDPAYQYYALRFAEVLVKRYKDHPALFAFGLCNEQGSGYISYSEYARQRFVNWLKKKYKTVERLNEAWAARRWSRKLNSFDDAVLQVNELTVGPPEAWLDMRRFFGDGIGDFMAALKETVEKNAPGVPHSSNHYSGHPKLGFDYLKEYRRFVDYPGIGLYPGFMPDKNDSWAVRLPGYMERLAETDKPMWVLEIQTGHTDVYHGIDGVNRMYVFLSLLHRAQMVLGWTFRSMLGGEEQFHLGMIDHDGTPTPNYDEYKRAAQDFKKLEKYGFPYLPKPEIAVAASHDSGLIGAYHPTEFKKQPSACLLETVKALEKRNCEYNIVDLRSLHKQYRLLIVPEQIVMDPASEQTIREFTAGGGTVIMTSQSAVIDETGKVFGTPKPGGLCDVFGIRVKGFHRTHIYNPWDETLTLIGEGDDRHELVTLSGTSIKLELDIRYYENLELDGAESIARFEGTGGCAVSRNSYGKGEAYYAAAECGEELMGWLIDEMIGRLSLEEPPVTPDGICARRIAKDQTFFVNRTGRTIPVPLSRGGWGVLSEKEYQDCLMLAPYDGELIVEKKDKTADVK